MPLKRTYSTSTTVVPATKRTRAAAKRRRAYPANGTVGRPMPFPTRMVGKLKYCETISFQSSLVSVSGQFWSANSIYDPNRSGSGHQPYGHDTYQSIYNHYTVLNSKISIKPANTNGALVPITYGVGIDDDVGTSPAYDTWAERPTYKTRQLVLNGAPDDKPLKHSWSRAKRFPHNDTYLTLSAPFGSSPTEEEFFVMVVQSGTSGTAIGTVYMNIEIEYTCEFYELKDLGSS